MAEFDYQKQAQDHYARAPVIILGSGASIAFGLPSMEKLAESIKSSTDSTKISSDQFENWSKFCEFLDKGTDLEKALDLVNFSQDMTNLIVRSAWKLINTCDEEVYKRSFMDRSTFPLGKLLTHMFKSSLNKLNIITTNYDCLAEYACDQEQVHYYNGFSHGYTKRISDPKHVRCDRVVNIWKVHGSVDWFYSEDGETISVVKSQYVPDEYEPQIVTPGVQKYQKTHLEPFRTIIGSADKALKETNSFLCFGFGFNDEHIQPNLLSKCKRDNASITIATHTLTNQAKALFMSGNIKNFLAIERGESDEQSRVYSSLYDKPILVDANCWSMAGFIKLIM